MNRFSLLLVAACIAMPVIALSQQNSLLLPYQAPGYKYQIVNPNAQVIKTFQGTAFNDAAWQTGTAAFGTVNQAGQKACPLNDAVHIKVAWQTSQDLLIRKHFTVPSGAANVKVAVAVESQAQVFVNGTDISGGVQDQDSCASLGNFVFTVPASLVKTGDNVLAVHGVIESNTADDPYWRTNYLDVQVTADIPATITASAGPNGTISPGGAVVVPFAGNQTFTITPNTGYSIANVLVDGASVGAVSSYTFTDVLANHTISATFVIKTYPVAGTVTVGGAGLPGVTVTATGSGGFTASGVTTTGGAYTIGSNIPYGTTGVVIGASLTGYTFTPLSVPGPVTGPLTGENIKGTLNTYPVTGTVAVGGAGLPGVTVTATGSGGFTASGVTTTGGAYTISSNIPYGTTGIVIGASLTGYTFTPLSVPGPVTGPLSGENITGTLNTYPVTGTVTVGGAGLPGVTVTATGSGGFTASGVTTTGGAYTISSNIPYGTTGIVIGASLTGYTFTPLSVPGPVTGPLTGENITGTLNTYSVSGTVTVGGAGLPGVTVTATGSGGFTASGVTTTGGAYTISGVPHFTTGLTLAGTLTGYTFTPLSVSGTVTGPLSGENITGR